KFSDLTETSFMLSWNKPKGNRDSLFILIFFFLPGESHSVTVGIEHTTFTLSKLSPGTSYIVTVYTTHGRVQSDPNTSFLTTVPAPPTLFQATEVSDTKALLKWTPSLGKIDRFVISYESSKSKQWEFSRVKNLKQKQIHLSRMMYVLLQLQMMSVFSGKLRFPFPTECSQELLNGALQSGEVDVYPQGREGQAVRVYCDMESDGGGWTVFQRRMNGKTDFYRTWSEYNTGFGNISEEFWLGNRLLHNLTSIGPVSLRVDMRSGNDTAYAHYANFFIDSEERNYTLTISGYTGTAGDSMRYHNNRPFSTRDKDPDPLGIHCSRAYMGGWWYKNCYKTNLNGLYGINSNNQGIVWIDWKGKDSSIPFTEMKFRPSRFSPATHG
uniref:Fibrinogen C-terminal domain-containing protein n=1 Tax=Neogobius melanostomus TaxID=47308 RepID=A0A8C6SE66_9GOBI